MAANDYYQPAHHPSDPYHDHDRNDYDAYDDRHEAPLPPLPASSPFDDGTHPYAHRTPSQSYAGSGARPHDDDADPFDDELAIPLAGRRPKHDSSTTIAPILPRQADDPFVRDADPRKRRRRASAGKSDPWFNGRHTTWVVYALTTIQLVVFLAQFIRNAVLTGTPIEIHPSFNPMIGPSPYLLINMGARYQPCMHSMPNVQNATTPISWPCPNATATTGASVSCSLSDLCGFAGVPDPRVGGRIDDQPAPNQWWRFIVPIFLHAGIVHIGFNLLLQMTLGRDVEKLIGSLRFTIVYFAAGIFGFVLGGNFAANGIASCGCSGSLFGILAITLLDLLYTWKQRPSPIKDLLFIVVDVLIAFVLGLLPGLDNFSHIGGFLMGLVLGVCILRSPTAFARRRDSSAPDMGNHTDYSNNNYNNNNIQTTSTDAPSGLQAFFANPLTFFHHRRPHWWAWWLVRVAALVGCLVGFILLLQNFYHVHPTTCSWCKYLSCLPVKDWCDVGNLAFEPVKGGA
ncbi:hypothetical protein LTR08_007837 [Meristemomyces frigidus]|nr:hypothetical protein LTR08_007837 [Meristemomyces frigidus]